MDRSRRGMTLLETLVTFSVISFLVSLSIPAIQRIRASADRTACQSNLRQMGLALHLFHQDHGRLPVQKSALSWMVHVLPYVEQKPLYMAAMAASEQSKNPLAVPPHQGAQTVVRVFICPTDSRLRDTPTDQWGTTAAFTTYLAAAGGVSPSGTSYAGALPGQRFADIRDGLSNTVCIGERPPPDTWQGGWWYPNIHYHTIGHRGPNGFLFLGHVIPYIPFDSECSPGHRALGPGRTANPCDRFHFWSLHGGGANFLFVDASVRFLPYSCDAQMPALISIANGDAVELPD